MRHGWRPGAGKAVAEGVAETTRTQAGRPGTTQGLTARGLQLKGGPVAPKMPTTFLGPQGTPAGIVTIADTAESRQACENSLPHTYGRPRPPNPPPLPRRALHLARERFAGAAAGRGDPGRHPHKARSFRSQTGEASAITCSAGEGKH